MHKTNDTTHSIGISGRSSTKSMNECRETFHFSLQASSREDKQKVLGKLDQQHCRRSSIVGGSDCDKLSNQA